MPDTLDFNQPGTAAMPTRRAVAQLKILLISAFVLPICLYLLAAVLTYRAFVSDAKDHIERTTNTAVEQASRIFTTDELVLDRIAERIAPMSWEQIAASAELHNFLQQMKRSLPQAQAIGVVGPDGRILNTDYAFPTTSLFLVRRASLDVHRNGAADLRISDVTPGPRTGTPLFSVSRNAPNADGSSNSGQINIATDPDDLTQYYDTLADMPGIHITLFRADGAILARNPAPAEAAHYDRSSDLMSAIAAHPASGFVSGLSQIDGRNRILFYRALDNYPLYVATSYDVDALRQRWLLTMGSHLIYGIPVTLSLILVTLSAIRRTEREQRALAQAHEETEKRALAEGQLREAQRLEAVGQLTGGIAHDFNNILTVIVGNLDLLSRQAAGDTAKRMIDTMQRAASRGSRLTQSLLAFARRQSLRPEIVNPNRLINEVAELLRQAVGEAIELNFVLSPTLDPCRVDPAQFEAALLNLVVNARDAVAEKGRKIIVQTENVVFDERHRPPLPVITFGSYIAVSVIDNGEGMTPEVVSRVFEPFFTTKEVGRGSGLGLSQVYGFVKQSGGYVYIDSEPGIGTKVHLYLPRSTETSENPELFARREFARKEAEGATILLVEDEPDVREVLAAEITNFGYRIVTAGSGPEALSILDQEGDIDLLFSDVVMPGGMRGDELARQAREMRPSLKVLLTSGYPAPDLRERQVLGEFRVLRKPYRAEDLMRALTEALNT